MYKLRQLWKVLIGWFKFGQTETKSSKRMVSYKSSLKSVKPENEPIYYSRGCNPMYIPRHKKYKPSPFGLN